MTKADVVHTGVIIKNTSSMISDSPNYLMVLNLPNRRNRGEEVRDRAVIYSVQLMFTSSVVTLYSSLAITSSGEIKGVCLGNSFYYLIFNI